MKRILMAAVVAVVLGGTAQASMVDYATLYGGVTMDPDLKYGPAKYSMDTGYNVGGGLGWDLSPGFSLGVDLMFTHSGYTCCTSSLETFSIMANGYYTFDIGSPVKPYVGLGAGGVQVTFDSSPSPSSGSDFVFGYQAEVGVSVPIANKIDLVVGYKYQGASDASIEGAKVEYKSNNLSAGLVFDLN